MLSYQQVAPDAMLSVRVVGSGSSSSQRAGCSAPSLLLLLLTDCIIGVELIRLLNVACSLAQIAFILLYLRMSCMKSPYARAHARLFVMQAIIR